MFTGSIILFSISLYKLVVACSDGPDPYDIYPQFFPPSVTQAPAFTPFHYTAELKYYDEWYDYKSDETIPDANLQEWASYTNGKVPLADLDSFIYKYSYTDLSNWYNHIEKNSPYQSSNPDLPKNAFSKWFESTRDLEGLGYLMFAKSCEVYAARVDWEVPGKDSLKMNRLIRNGQQLFAVAKNDFIRERYAYQVLRMAFYSGQNKNTLLLYTKLIGDNSNRTTSIAARSLGIKAGALFRLNRKTEAAYLYSRVFDLNDNEKRNSFISFDWSTTKDIKPVLALCKSAHEKAVVHVMDGLHNFDQALPQIQAAYAADPEVKGLDVLFTREINKVEQRYQQFDLLSQRNLEAGLWYYNSYGGTVQDANSDAWKTARQWKEYAATLNSFAQKAATESKNAHHPFWLLAASYLYYVQGDINNTKRYMDLAAAGNMSSREHDLHDVINALWIIRKNGRMNAATETELLPSMKWLDERASKNNGLNKIYRDLLSTVLTTAYLKAGDTVKAVYCLARVTHDEQGKLVVDEDFQDLPGQLLERMSTDKLRQLQAFVNARNPGPWDAWLITRSPYTTDVLAELEGTKFLREFQFREAAVALKKVGNGYLKNRLLPDPFVFHIEDELQTDSQDTLKMYTKLEFAQKMSELEGKEDSKSLFDLGNGLYGMSYYGKAHHAFDYYRGSTDELGYYESPERKALSAYRQEYYRVVRAEQAFQKAALKATEPEFRAKCLWMAAKCWQKRCPIPKATVYWERAGDSAYYHNSLKNPYYLQLTGDLGTTVFMKEAFGSCVYLRDYSGIKH